MSAAGGDRDGNVVNHFDLSLFTNESSVNERIWLTKQHEAATKERKHNGALT